MGISVDAQYAIRKILDRGILGSSLQILPLRKNPAKSNVVMEIAQKLVNGER
jgi:hypothetical protein